MRHIQKSKSTKETIDNFAIDGRESLTQLKKIEKRKFFRKNIFISGVVQSTTNERKYFALPVLIENISLSGAKLLLIEERSRRFIKIGETFELIYHLKYHEKPFIFRCIACRIQESEQCFCTGVKFIDSSFEDFQRVAFSLMGSL